MRVKHPHCEVNLVQRLDCDLVLAVVAQQVLEVDEKPTGTMYLVNAWYKEHKMIPQFIPGVFVARFEVSNSCGICGELPAVAVHAHYRVCQPCLGSLHLHGLDAWSAYVTSEHARGRSVNREEPA